MEMHDRPNLKPPTEILTFSNLASVGDTVRHCRAWDARDSCLWGMLFRYHSRLASCRDWAFAARQSFGFHSQCYFRFAPSFTPDCQSNLILLSPTCKEGPAGRTIKSAGKRSNQIKNLKSSSVQGIQI